MKNNLQPIDIMFAGKRVHIRTGGRGRSLLLLHSAWGDADMSWAPVWNELSRFFTVIAPDLPGFGASDPLDEPSLSAHARVLKVMLDIQKANRGIVVGNSFGAAIAVEFASSFPERTRGLVLVNGTNLPLMPGFMRKLISFPAMERRFRSFMRKFTYSDRAFIKAFPDLSKLSPGFFERIRRNQEKQSRVVFDTFLNQTMPQIPPAVPTTVIWGTGDRLVTKKQAENLRKWLGNAKYVTIEGAGHMPQLERPGEFVEAIKRVGAEL